MNLLVGRFRLTDLGDLVFQEYGQDIVAAITFYPSPVCFIQLGDPKTIKVSIQLVVVVVNC